MPLKVQLHRAGNAAVFHCDGPIISGPEAEYLEKTLDLELREGSKRLVLEIATVTRVDSGGLGLLVRLLMRARKDGGDLKLAAAPGFVINLLQATRLATLLEVFPSAQDAVMSYQHLPKARIVFFDPSSDICAFVQTLLTANGYEVLATSFINDAKTLLKSGKTDFLILGPNTSDAELSAASAAVSMAAVTPAAVVIKLSKDFQESDAERAGTALLQLIAQRSGNVVKRHQSQTE